MYLVYEFNIIVKSDKILKMIRLIVLFLGGGLGTLTRYFISKVTNRFFLLSFPFGTTFVNMSGSFLIGFLWSFFDVIKISPNTRAFIFIGFLGGYTTFSTYMLENLNYFRDNEAKTAGMNILVSNILGLVLVFFGFLLGKYLISVFRR